MTRAFVYLEWHRAVNGLRQRLQRLRQPRYFFGAIFGAAYFYFFFVRRLVTTSPPLSAQLKIDRAWMETFGAVMMLFPMAGAWIFSGGRAALNFSEAEIAFLFPAPISRRTLINYKLLRSQLATFFMALVLTFVTRRGSMIGGPSWIHLVGWWLGIAFLNLHLIAAGFTRDRLLQLGITPTRRATLIGVILASFALVSYLWIQAHPLQIALDQPTTWTASIVAWLNAPPLGWLIAALRCVLRPSFAPDARAFLLALGPALALIALHYLWIIRAEVSFEEGSVDAARKRAAWIENNRQGRIRARTRARPAPFALKPNGPAWLAFGWRNLIEFGTFFYPRTALSISAGAIAILVALARHFQTDDFAKLICIGSGIIAGYVFIFAPMLAWRRSQRLLERLDSSKALPVAGWQVIAGELSATLYVFSWLEWTLAACFCVGVWNVHGPTRIGPETVFVMVGALALLAPLLAGMLFGVNLGAALYFPAWAAQSAAGPGGGIEKFGQRLIFIFGYLIAVLVALIPALAIGGGAGLLCQWIYGSLFADVLVGAPLAALVLAAEFAAVLWWLGRRYERFDLSSELPR